MLIKITLHLKLKEWFILSRMTKEKLFINSQSDQRMKFQKNSISIPISGVSMIFRLAED
jgi:hypothetical protein